VAVGRVEPRELMSLLGLQVLVAQGGQVHQVPLGNLGPETVVLVVEIWHLIHFVAALVSLALADRHRNRRVGVRVGHILT
jgi:hypothetical protein